MTRIKTRINWSPFRRPGWPEVAVALITYLLFLGIVSVVILRMPDEQAVLRGNFGMAGNGIAGVAALAAAYSLRIRDLGAFGFRAIPWRWRLVGAAIGIAAYGVSRVMESVYFLFVTESNTQADFQAGATGGTWSLLILLFTGAVLTPLGEEAVFRGVIANSLNRYGAWVGVVGSALIFAAMHGPSVIFLNALLVGILAAILFRKTASIWPGLLVHVVFNGLWLVTYALA